MDSPSPKTNEGLLGIHELHHSYKDFIEFQPDLPWLLQQGALTEDCIKIARTLGILEPFTRAHIPPEVLQIQGPNWRESLIANGLLSRNRAVLWLLEDIYGSVEALQKHDIYLTEARTGFAIWLRHLLGEGALVCSEYLDGSEFQMSGIQHQDLCALSYADSSFDLILCNEVLEHVSELEAALLESARVLRPGGRLVSTCPLAFGQESSIIKAFSDPDSGETKLLEKPELHGDPIRPSKGSLVYRIPGWEILNKLEQAGFRKTRMHHIASWKYGVLGSDLPGVLVIEAER